MTLSWLTGDLRDAWRSTLHTPGIALVVVLTLALGIGANTALFSVVNALLIDPLPYPGPSELVTLHESKPNFPQGSISLPNFLDWQRANQTFSAMAVSRPKGFTWSSGAESERLRGALITSDFFRLLGVNARIGRTFTVGEDRPGAAPVALVSEGFWHGHLAASGDVIGRSLALDGRDYRIVGVIPSEFDLQLGNFRPGDVYVPIGQWSNSALWDRSAGLGIHGIGRLRRTVTLAQAQADMDRVTRNLASEYPDVDAGVGATLVPLNTSVVGEVRPLLLSLAAAVAFVLLIACVNVANIVLARSSARNREFAVRAALGASPARLIRQLLTESLVLASMGGALGLLIAAWGTQAAIAALPAALPRAAAVHVDLRVVTFSLAISVASGLLFGLVPAFRSSGANLHDALKESGRGASGTRHRTQSTLVVAEMALALVLLVGAGLTIRTLVRLAAVDPGFKPENVLTFGLVPAHSNASEAPAASPASAVPALPADAIRASHRAVRDALAATPGMRAVSFSWGAFPLSGDDEQLFWIEGQPKPASENDMNWALRYIVDPGYLAAMGIRLVSGRFIDQYDDERSRPVAVVDDVFAAKYFPGHDAIGARLVMSGASRPTEIVGIVGHVKQWGLDADDTHSLRAQIYVPFGQLDDVSMIATTGGVTVVLRAYDLDAGLLARIRATISRVDADRVVYGAQTMEEIVGSSLAARRFSMVLFAVFAAVALGLSAIGIYGVVSYLVGEQLHEIGVRLALGARSVDVLRLVVGHASRLALLGIAIGAVGALAIARLMTRSSLVVGVSAADPATFGLVAAVLMIVALAACCVPVRRALRADPLRALRAE